MKEIRNGGLVFVCDDPIEVSRAETLFTKEPGTIQWLRDTIQSGDVFYDIGANIGCYTLFAASLGATVYAFEPHIVNAVHLKRNVKANGFTNVHVCDVALNSFESEDYAFSYASMRAGSSGSQWGHETNEHGFVFTPEAVAPMRATTIDVLLSLGGIREAQIVKLDVDGNECEILRGMAGLLKRGVRSLQVEDNAMHRDQLRHIMQEYGYSQTGQHFTANGAAAIRAGADPVTITDNAIFTRVPVLA